MCCAKKKLAKLEAEVAELKAAIERLQAAIPSGAKALPPATPMPKRAPWPESSEAEINRQGGQG